MVSMRVLHFFLLVLTLLSVNVNAQQKQSSGFISLGSSLSPSTEFSSWLSPSGLFAFGFYNQSNGFAIGIWLVGPLKNTITWTAKRNNPPLSANATMKLTNDGRLILLNGKGEEKPIADVAERAGSSSMLDSGNFVLYGKNRSSTIWESFDFPTDTILGGQSLRANDNLTSSQSKSLHSSGKYTLPMQGDGNLVAYPVNSSMADYDSYWSTGTPATSSNMQLHLNETGYLSLQLRGVDQKVLVNGSDLVDSRSSIIYRATLDPDGIFWLYLHQIEDRQNSNESIIWSNLQDQCDVKGFCGLNSFCSGNALKGECFCIPGFNFLDPNKKFLGCYKNFSEDGCSGRRSLTLSYNISALENLMWEGVYYSMAPMKKESCLESCKEDCNCGAARYSSDDCYKYKFPLMYSKRNPNISATAFFISGKSEIPSHIPSPPIIVKQKGKEALLVILPFGLIAGLCLIFAILSFFMYRHRDNKYKKLLDSANPGIDEDYTLRFYTYEELEKVTDGFKDLIGKGKFGTVYNGVGSAGKRIAVKRLERMAEEGERRFRTEMATIGRTHHRNLVRLIGFSIKNSQMLLVYEYMSKGSLIDLFKAEIRPSWTERTRIALDVARGILYLHEECEIHLVHCNIKPQNILLDDTMTAKISDFGLAKLLMPNQSRTQMENQSISGYLAPELQKNPNLVSDKVDVYSYGIVLLEIACWRSSLEGEMSRADEIALTIWAYNCLVDGNLSKLVDHDEYVDMKILERMVQVGLWCVQDDPSFRPPMKNVILMLEGTMDIPILPSSSFLVVSG